MEITLAMTIICCIMTVLNFVFNRKDKATNDKGKDSYNMGVINEKIENISKQIDKILNKLDTYDLEVKEQIDEAFEHHIREYHRQK